MLRCGKYWPPLPARVLLVAVAASVWVSCRDDGAGVAGPPVDLVLVAQPPALTLVPGAFSTIVFHLSDKTGRNRSSDTVRFALVAPASPAPNEPGIAGASILTAQGSTNSEGNLSVTVRAGSEGRFQLRASYSGASDALVPVTVAGQDEGLAEAIVATEGTPLPASLQMRLYEGVSCEKLSVTSAPPPDPQNVHTMPVASRWSLPTLARGKSYGLVAKAFDQAGAIGGFGCVVIAGSQLLQAAPVTFVVPLNAIAVSFASRFESASEFVFSPEQAKGAEAVAVAWGRLSKCGRGPVQIWLDCTLDALGPQGAASAPLDCVPEADEGPVGELLAAKRGVFTVEDPACRGLSDQGGQPSADKQVFELFAKPATDELAALPDLAKAAAGLFARIRFSSTLEIAPSGQPGTWLITHTARNIGFPVGDAFFPIQLSDRPGKISRFILSSVNETQTQLSIASHGFGLNVGAAAHAAFGARLFSAQGFPADERAFLDALFKQAVLSGAGAQVSGCAALDALLCPQIGQGSGCLERACLSGVGALATMLTTGFDALASEDLDLFLQGTAQLTDLGPDGVVHGLGTLVPNRGSPGLWSAELRGKGGVSTLAGLWVAVAQAAP